VSQQVQTTIFTQGTRLLAHWGELNREQAAIIASHVGQEWDDASPTARIQFMRLPPHPGDMLLYTRRVDENFQLTLVAAPETPLTVLRIQSDPLMHGLQEVVAGRQITFSADMNQDVLETGGR